MSKITRTVAAGILAGSLLLIFPSAAQADNSGSVSSSSWYDAAGKYHKSGATASWHYRAYDGRLWIEICDTAADGKGAVAILLGPNTAVWDRDGANNSCNEKVVWGLNPIDWYSLQACIGVYSTGAINFCNKKAFFTN